MKCKVLKDKTTRWERMGRNPFIPTILNMYHDAYWQKFNHMHKSDISNLNKRLKFYWAHWGQIRNINYKHDFKNHYIHVPTVAEIEQEIQEIEQQIQNYAKQDLYSANCTAVKFLYQRLRELRNEQYLNDDDDYEPYFIDGSDVPICGNYE